MKHKRHPYRKDRIHLIWNGATRSTRRMGMPIVGAIVAVVFLCVVNSGCTRPGGGEAPIVSTTAEPGSGVRGTVTVDVGCPVLESSSPCPRAPLRARIIVRQPGRATPLTMAETRDDGRFEIRLAPGVYELQGTNLTGQPVPVARPITITIIAGRFTDTAVEFDSGIRGAPPGN